MRGILARLLLGLGIAAVLTLGLAYCLGREADRAERSADRDAAILEDYRLPPTITRGEAFLIYVVGPGHAVPARIAPVAAITSDGGVRMERGPPSPDGPEPGPWLAAGIVVPEARLRSLDPRSRAALLELLRSWRGTIGRGSSWRAVAVGLEDPEELAVLARWER